MTVEEIKGEDIVCKVINGGFVSNHKGVNVPGAILSMPYISEVDLADIVFGVEHGFDLSQLPLSEPGKIFRKCARS